MLRKYKLTIAIDNRTIDIQDQVETNYREGEAAQMANLFYRAMLAVGFSPAVACESLGKVAAAGGYIHGQPFDGDEQEGLFNFTDGDHP